MNHIQRDLKLCDFATVVDMHDVREVVAVNWVICTAFYEFVKNTTKIEKQNFGFIKRADKGWITTVKDL